jgi:hypothetical protein
MGDVEREEFLVPDDSPPAAGRAGRRLIRGRAAVEAKRRERVRIQGFSASCGLTRRAISR